MAIDHQNWKIPGYINSLLGTNPNICQTKGVPIITGKPRSIWTFQADRDKIMSSGLVELG